METSIAASRWTLVLRTLKVNMDASTRRRERRQRGRLTSDTTTGRGRESSSHTHIHTHIHMYSQTHTHAYMHTHTHMYVYACTHTHTHMYVYAHTHTHRYIHSVNRQNLSYKLKVNHMTDFSDSEFKMMRGYRRTQGSPRGELYTPSKSVRDVPEYFNWRLRGQCV